jgi:hypothetical protein
MPVLSYVHQLFNAEQCQAYIHTPHVQGVRLNHTIFAQEERSAMR